MNDLEPVVWLIVFVISVTAHEAAHALAAWLGGDPTAYQGGQVSLNPLPHMQREPMGMVLIPLITTFTNGWPMGWASTPYDPFWAERHPRRAAWMAAAGPGANLALALAALLFLKIGLATGLFLELDWVKPSRLVAGDVDWIDGMGRFTSMMLYLNTVLCILNLMPLPPLDGASVVTLFLPERLAHRVNDLVKQPGFAMVGLLVVWFGFGPLIRPIFGVLNWLVYG